MIYIISIPNVYMEGGWVGCYLL